MSSEPSAPGAPQPQSSLRRSLDLLWRGRTPATKGPRPGLTLDQIVTTAIEVADTEGVDALSMRRIARGLGVGTMTLYRYIPDKTVLLNLVMDRVSLPEPDRAGASPERSWREAIENDAWQGRALYLRHPWLLQLNWARPAMGPNSVADVERQLGGMRGLPFSDREKINLITTVDAYVTGSVRQEIQYQRATQETGLSDEEFWGITFPALEEAMESGQFPILAQLDEDSFEGGWEETFAGGLAFLLDGIELEVDRRHAGGAE
ncbi:TetR/AcrR family transcriptional regulator [Georgenia halophila]|uniref:TetR/AcrR family transcriptional regulator n=1 Tax=Georgenia halophila TaxID=620889 RepID=A0ABP8KWW6_9MICO